MTLQRIFFWMLAWALSGFLSPLRAQDKAKHIDSMISLKTSMHLFSGTVLVYHHGKTILHKAYGWQDAGKKIANSTQSIYQIYSVTKPFTSTMILMLVEQGKLSLNDKLSKFYQKVNGADSITIRHLLSHQSGLFEFTRLPDTVTMTIPRFLSVMEKQPLDFTPGTHWSYCNSGYWFLGLIIERITGLPYNKAVAQYIFQPVQMRHSGFNYAGLADAHKTKGYAVYQKSRREPARSYNPPGPYAAGDIWSTTSDLLLFHKAMQRNVLLSVAMTKQAYTPVANQYGFGWMIDSVAGKQVVKHSGGAAGYRSYLIRVPEDDLCVVILGNTENDINGLSARILNTLYGMPAPIPSNRKIAVDVLKQYEGVYQLQQGLLLQAYVDDGYLFIQPVRQPRTILYPETDDRFYVEEIDGFVRFLRDHKSVDTLQLIMRGQMNNAPRIQDHWGITGSATNNGWDGPDIAMQPGPVKGVWVIRNISLKDGEVKFRMNNSWDFNYGADGKSKLILDGANISVKAGIYDVILDLQNPARATLLMKIKNQ
jgi:CubicO group peptidase (beta-lactamase class C family)